MELHGLRPLTWRDGLFWARASRMMGLAVLWCALVLWMLSGLYEIGPVTMIVVAAIGGCLGALVVDDERRDADLPRWPRRTDPD